MGNLRKIEAIILHIINACFLFLIVVVLLIIPFKSVTSYHHNTIIKSIENTRTFQWPIVKFYMILYQYNLGHYLELLICMMS